ncbi:MAG: adenylate/guanylate cyclase domain-containing protein [Magnetococcales bacterium]|nr:adenylate/guanylate cyclase domain-containing protein [Magnetococcales bacterium]
MSTNETENMVSLNDELEKKISEIRDLRYNLLRVKKSYGRFVPKNLISLIGVDEITEVNLGDQAEKKLTVLFSDIRNFSTFSENLSSEEIFNFINSYMGVMEPPINRNNGIIDKFIGDAIMALFPGTPDQALCASIAMMESLTHYNKYRKSKGYSDINIGIGLNTGIVTFGIIGHLKRMEGTVLGDAVNVASRVESLTKQYKVNILIGEDAYIGLENPDAFCLRLVDRIRVKGRLRPVSIYECFDSNSPEEIRNKLISLGLFNKGVACYHMKAVDEAFVLFNKCQEIAPEDTVVSTYLDRCKTFQERGVFDGVDIWLEAVEWREEYSVHSEDIDVGCPNRALAVDRFLDRIPWNRRSRVYAAASSG